MMRKRPLLQKKSKDRRKVATKHPTHPDLAPTPAETSVTLGDQAATQETVMRAATENVQARRERERLGRVH